MEQLHDGDPKSIGPYRPIARLGSGGMGRVYLCTLPGVVDWPSWSSVPSLADDAGFRTFSSRGCGGAARAQPCHGGGC